MSEPERTYTSGILITSLNKVMVQVRLREELVKLVDHVAVEWDMPRNLAMERLLEMALPSAWEGIGTERVARYRSIALRTYAVTDQEQAPLDLAEGERLLTAYNKKRRGGKLTDMNFGRHRPEGDIDAYIWWLVDNGEALVMPSKRPSSRAKN